MATNTHKSRILPTLGKTKITKLQKNHMKN